MLALFIFLAFYLPQNHIYEIEIEPGFVTRLTGRVTLVEEELITLSEHLCSPSVLSEIHVTTIFSFMCMFCRSLFVLLSFFVGHCVVCLSCIYHLGILITPLISSNYSYILSIRTRSSLKNLRHTTIDS